MGTVTLRGRGAGPGGSRAAAASCPCLPRTKAVSVMWKVLMVAQTRFRRLNAPELLAKVYVGVRYEDGIELTGKEAA